MCRQVCAGVPRPAQLANLPSHHLINNTSVVLLLLQFTEHALQVRSLNVALKRSSVTTIDLYSAVAVFTAQMELFNNLLNLIHSSVHYLFPSHPVVIMGRFI